MIQWRDALSVGHDMIDSDHKQLIGLINLFETGKEENIETTLFELIEYTRSHFTREENLMNKARFPFIEAHKKAHAQLLTEAEAYLRRWETMPRLQHLAMVEQIGLFLRGWIIDHIINEDLAMKPYVKNVR